MVYQRSGNFLPGSVKKAVCSLIRSFCEYLRWGLVWYAFRNICFSKERAARDLFAWRPPECFSRRAGYYPQYRDTSLSWHWYFNAGWLRWHWRCKAKNIPGLKRNDENDSHRIPVELGIMGKTLLLMADTAELPIKWRINGVEAEGRTWRIDSLPY